MVKAKVTKVTPKKKSKPYATPDWPERFLEALREWPNVSAAAKRAGVSRMEVYRTKNTNPEFAAQWNDARLLGIEAVEDEAIQMVRLNPTMMIFMLKNLKPEIYSDKHTVELSWRDEAKRRGYDPDQLFRDMVNAARRRLAESGGGGSVAGSDRGSGASS